MNNISTQDLQNVVLAWSFMLIAGPFFLAFVMNLLEKDKDNFGLAYIYGVVLTGIGVMIYAGLKLLRWIL